MAHRACAIDACKNLGFPNGLPQIIADYAALTGYCRFNILLQKFPIGSSFRTDRYTYHSFNMHRFLGCLDNIFSDAEISTYYSVG